VLPQLEEAAATLIADGRVWKVVFDTYERELERYGGAQGLRIAERIFSADSTAVLAILRTLRGDAGADSRWRLALVGMDRLLSDFGLALADKQAFAKRLRQAFGQELVVDKILERQLGDRFRRDRAGLDPLFDAVAARQGAYALGVAALGERSQKLGPLAEELRSLERAGELGVRPDVLLESYVHMHVNRMIRALPRQHEFVLYDFLGRLYESQLARAKAKKAPATSA
jgi:thiopeptide-type bacteriocin biosynthesis protein